MLNNLIKLAKFSQKSGLSADDLLILSEALKNTAEAESISKGKTTVQHTVVPPIREVPTVKVIIGTEIDFSLYSNHNVYSWKGDTPKTTKELGWMAICRQFQNVKTPPRMTLHELFSQSTKYPLPELYFKDIRVNEIGDEYIKFTYFHSDKLGDCTAVFVIPGSMYEKKICNVREYARSKTSASPNSGTKGEYESPARPPEDYTPYNPSEGLDIEKSVLD